MLFTKHRPNQKAYQFLAIVPQMHKYHGIHDEVPFPILPPDKKDSKWYVACENVFLTPVEKKLLDFMLENGIEIEIPFITDNADYAPDKEKLSGVMCWRICTHRLCREVR